ncbi:MAG: hypothetical protein CMJ48_15050 [Planctomycetaceae bacterium]|nr:hypothetical protein [Planctomycetaceae bacterium]
MLTMNSLPLASPSLQSGHDEPADSAVDIEDSPQLTDRGLEILSTINEVFEGFDQDGTAN